MSKKYDPFHISRVTKISSESAKGGKYRFSNLKMFKVYLPMCQHTGTLALLDRDEAEIRTLVVSGLLKRPNPSLHFDVPGWIISGQNDQT